MSAAAELRAAAQKLRDAVADDTAVALHPETVRAFAAWLDIAADYADRWPDDQQTNSPFRAQALEVARAIGGQP